jgi:hypothetical protein
LLILRLKTQAGISFSTARNQLFNSPARCS